MSTTTLPAEARAFLDAVRAELADLPDDEAGELLEDVEQHLIDAVDDGRLAELGAPAAYAAELRAAAGLPARQPTVLKWAPVRHARRWHARLAGTRAYQEVRAFAPELRPGWWVLRGYLAAVALAVWTHDSLRDVVPIPHVSGNVLLGILVTAAAIVGSVAWGRRSAGYDRRLRWATVAANAGAVFVGLAVLQNAAATKYHFEYVPAKSTPGLHGPFGPVTDIYPYDAQGQPLDGVLLFDANGHAIAPQVCDTWCPKLSFPLSDAERMPIRPDSPYNLAPATPPPTAFATPTPAASASPSATPSPSRSATPTPKPTPTKRR